MSWKIKILTSIKQHFFLTSLRPQGRTTFLAVWNPMLFESRNQVIGESFLVLFNETMWSIFYECTTLFLASGSQGICEQMMIMIKTDPSYMYYTWIICKKKSDTAMASFQHITQNQREQFWATVITSSSKCKASGDSPFLYPGKPMVQKCHYFIITQRTHHNTEELRAIGHTFNIWHIWWS